MNNQKGFALITVLFLLTVMAALLGAFNIMTRGEMQTTKASSDAIKTFYAAEGGLNYRAELIRDKFVGYNRPTGTPPTSTSPCAGSNLGTGDFACQNLALGMKTAVTFISEDPTNPLNTVVPPGERFQNLHSQEYRYVANSFGKSPDAQTGAALKLNFISRLIPLFQFAAFYDKDSN